MTEDKIELEILKKYVKQHEVASIADPQMQNKCARELDMREVLQDLLVYRDTREMILDIDNSNSVQALVNTVSKHWFNPESMYSELKTLGKTNLPYFWGITTCLLADVSDYLDQTSEGFLDTWNQKYITHDVKIMGYHCTHHSNKEVFIEKGILPLSNETIRITGDRNQTFEAKRMWVYRSQRSPGPWFLLSYKDAKNPNNHFCLNGPEILLSSAGYQVNVDPAKSIPLIIHCAIPYSILPDKDYYAFCILRAYFNFIDPEERSGNLFEGYSIDLKGNALKPQYIIRIEEI